jgi:hypothetical protein
LLKFLLVPDGCASLLLVAVVVLGIGVEVGVDVQRHLHLFPLLLLLIPWGLVVLVQVGEITAIRGCQ